MWYYATGRPMPGFKQEYTLYKLTASLKREVTHFTELKHQCEREKINHKWAPEVLEMWLEINHITSMSGKWSDYHKRQAHGEGYLNHYRVFKHFDYTVLICQPYVNSIDTIEALVEKVNHFPAVYKRVSDTFSWHCHNPGGDMRTALVELWLTSGPSGRLPGLTWESTTNMIEVQRG
jgi:hypothetical protein